MAALRPGFGPTLPALLRQPLRDPARSSRSAWRRWSRRPAIVAVIVALTRPPSPGEQVVHAGTPVFNLLYPPAALRVAKPRAGELLRLRGPARQARRVAVVVRPLELPPYRGDVTHGLLPVYADRFVGDGSASSSAGVAADRGGPRAGQQRGRLRDRLQAVTAATRAPTRATCCSCPTTPRRRRAS